MKKEILACPWKCPRMGLGAASRGCNLLDFSLSHPNQPGIRGAEGRLSAGTLEKALLPLAQQENPAGNSPDPSAAMKSPGQAGRALPIHEEKHIQVGSLFLDLNHEEKHIQVGFSPLLLDLHHSGVFQTNPEVPTSRHFPSIQKVN